jgi:23S rRNA pseudouridine2605 synthase
MNETHLPRKSVGSTKAGLARAMSKSGYCSRTRAVALIREGKVTLNGKITRDPEAPVTLERDRIQVEGTALQAARPLYLIMNKPRGIITTASDEKGRPTVYSLLPEGMPWLGPVGRLDKASEGLILLTNDSAWAARISDPQSHVAKTYHVQVGSRCDDDLLRKLSHGVRDKEYGILRAASASFLRGGEKNSWLEIVLTEGRNRQIRRMFEALGIEVLRLIRVAIGPVPLGTLAKGQCRSLTGEEKSLLDQVL